MPTILVTGASRGIGAATLAELRRRGATVAGHSTRGDADLLGADLAVPGAADALWAAALDRLGGRIDVLVNNAGVYEPADPAWGAEQWREGWTRTMQINLYAAADLCRQALRHWHDGGRGGRMVNLGSRAAYRGDGPDYANYAASKAAMVAMTKTYARAHAAEGVLAYCVAPGFVMTGMADDYVATRGAAIAQDIPLGRVATVEEAAGVIAYAALDAPPSMTGAVLDLNGASYVR